MSAPATNGTPSEILIAEDSATQALRLQSLLEQRGYRVTSARNGQLALDALAALRPAAIISDIQMPVMDGFELCRRIKADPHLASIPLILLTTLSAPQDIIHGLECGADNFVVKPYEDDFLLSRLDTALANRDIGNGDTSAGIPIHFAGKRYVIASDRRQILSLLLSTYETALKTNESLIAAQEALRTAQGQLIEAEKLQSVGRLAAGVAHEVKNPLAIIEMAADLLATKPDAETVDILIGEMKESVLRANKVITGLMDLSMADESGMKETSLDAVTDRVLAALESDIVRSNVTVVRDYAPALPLCRIDVPKIEQVISNVISNALQEMPHGGTLTVSAAKSVLLPTEVNFESGDRTGSRIRRGDTAVILKVRDTGNGIEPANLNKVFDPFFSTKPTGKGIGLGLTVARKFMELHGGRITLANAAESGAEATLCFKSV